LWVFSGDYLCSNVFQTISDYIRKTPWKLSPTRKANVRARLKKVDAVIEAVRASGVECSALVCLSSRYALSRYVSLHIP
jgi:hypothetical protein